MAERLEVWTCPECSSPSFYWHYRDEDGVARIAVLPSVPDTSPGAIEAAKARDRQQRAEGRRFGG